MPRNTLQARDTAAPGRPGSVDARIAAVWRIESARIIGAVARVVRDVGLAEDLAQEALVAALEHWPRDGVPDNPGAWLMATAKNRALDWLRQRALHERKQGELGADADARGDHVVPDFSDALDAAREDYGDDLLRLVFAACHPVLAREAQLALTLRLLGGLTTAEIARAFVVPEPTIAQRIVRAKRTLAEAKVPFEVPRGEALATRLALALPVAARRAGHADLASAAVALVLSDDASIAAHNTTWRGQARPTNVLAFAAFAPDEIAGLRAAPGRLLGDIVLAYETCAREARDQGKSLLDHATHLVVHGYLHLLGFDHEEDDAAVEMEGLESAILDELGLADPYAEPGCHV